MSVHITPNLSSALWTQLNHNTDVGQGTSLSGRSKAAEPDWEFPLKTTRIITRSPRLLSFKGTAVFPTFAGLNKTSHRFYYVLECCNVATVVVCLGVRILWAGNLNVKVRPKDL